MNLIKTIFKIGIVLAYGLAVAGLSAWLTVQVMIFEEERTVPNVVGLDLEEARKILRDHQFQLYKKREIANPDFPPGIIFEQMPKNGESLKVDRFVEVVISTGPSQNLLPNLEGLSLRKTKLELNHRGFKIGNITYVLSNLVAPNNIISHEPPQFSVREENTWVNLLVSSGPLERPYVMPNLIGLQYSTAVELFQNQFQLEAVRKATSKDVPPGTVLQQYPPSGYKIDRSSIVMIYVSL